MFAFGLLALLAATTTDFPTGTLIENVACRRDPSQTYTLYLPSSYSAERRWPLLLVFDPRGRGSFPAEIFREPAEKHGWILMSSNNTRSDGPWEPNAKALAAMWPEAHLRFSSDPARIYAAGFSGGAIVSWSLAQEPHQIAGIIAAGGRLPPEIPVQRIEFAHFGAAGVHDFNHLEMRQIDDLLARRGALHRLEIFPGGHRWLPRELAAEAVVWMEIVAMKKGLRPRDDQLIEATYAADTTRAYRLEKERRKLDAARQWEMVTTTYDGLRDIALPKERSRTLRSNRDVAREEREEKRWDEWEAERIERAHLNLGQLTNPEHHLPDSVILDRIGLGDLKKRAAAPTYAGGAAQRVLETIYVQTSFYLPQKLFGEKRFREAATILEIAVAIKDEPRAWYNLGAARARLDKHKEALDALEQAIRLGFKDLDHLKGDADYDSVRSNPRYARLIEGR